MSLDDKFYPEDGTALTAFDNRMIKLCGKVGEAYQWATGRSYVDLMRAGYAASSFGAFAGESIAIGENPWWGVMILAASIRCFEGVREMIKPSTTTPLCERLSEEAEEMPGYFRKRRTRFLGFGAIVGGTMLASQCAPEEYQSSLGGTIFFASYLPFAFAEYLSRSQMPKPPEKHILARAWDEIKELLVPQPALQPVPVPAQCMFSAYA